MNHHEIKLVIRLNNEGVLLLGQGHHSRACIAFEEAFDLLKQVVISCEEDDAAAAFSTCSYDRRNNAIPPFRESSFTLPGFQTAHLFVCNSPIIMEEASPYQKVEVNLSVYGAIVLFNVALVRHQQGRNGHERALMRAAMLYRLCLKLLECYPQHDTAKTVLILLVKNNQAQVYFEQCNYMQSRSCFEKVSEVIMSIKDINVLSKRILAGLYLNGVLAANPPNAARAA